MLKIDREVVLKRGYNGVYHQSPLTNGSTWVVSQA